jgi:alcohol dehydrogenase class IV
MLIADAMGLRVSDEDPVAAGLAAVEAVKALKRTIGLLETLKDFQVPDDPEKLQPTVELAASDSQIGYNPRYLEETEILELLRKAISFH